MNVASALFERGRLGLQRKVNALGERKELEHI
jgi:hypothetical protein